MKPTIALAVAALFLATATASHAKLVPIDEPGTHGDSGTSDTSGSLEDVIPAHPDTRNTVTCNYHGSTTSADDKYKAFAGPRTGHNQPHDPVS